MGFRTKGLLFAVVVATLSGCSVKSSCEGDSVDCGGLCVTLLADNLNCGACGNVCGVGTSCVSGTCLVPCPAGQVACGGTCVDPQTSATFCGATGDCSFGSAGTTCGTGQTCQAGACACASAGQVACGGSCIDPQTSVNHCGASSDCAGTHAGSVCFSGQICQAGACTCATSGQVACGGACLDPLTSATHCGASGDCAGANAGTACAAGQTCQAGACACPTAGQVACGGACVDPQTSATHCGASGNCAGANAGTACAAGETCQAGACASNCTPVELDLATPFAMTLPDRITSSPNPLAPTGLWASSSPPLPTNASWQNLVLDSGQTRLDILPYQVKAEPTLLDVASAGLTYSTSGVPIVSVKEIMQLKVGAAEFNGVTNPPVVAHDLLSVTLRYGSSPATMTVPLVYGMPYITFQYAGARPRILPGVDETVPGLPVFLRITSVNGATTSPVPGTKFKLALSDGSTWLLYASSSITFNWNQGEMVAPAAFTGTLRLANLPSSGAEVVLDAHAATIATAGEPKVTIACDVATLSFAYQTSGTGPLLVAAMPHQLARMASPAPTALTYSTMSGTLTGVEAPTASGISTLTMTLPLSTITWSAPQPISQDRRAAVLNALESDKTYQPDAAVVEVDAYFGGKQLAKLARLALIADDLQQTSTAATLRARLRPLLAQWLEWNNPNPFVYDTTWGGLVTRRALANPSVDFGQGRYNDHHFHYGYFLYAAAALAKGDPEFATRYAPGLRALVRDIANPSREDPHFPRFRHMDFFRSHSWASGLFNNAYGRDQESTSEAVNAWYGMQLLGLALDDARMSEIGRLLLALELDGARTYWQIPNSSAIYGDPFRQNMCVGRLYATRATFDTFFATGPEYVYGIQMLPYTPVSEALLSPIWIRDAWPKMEAAAASANQGWKGFLYMAHATTDRAAAWTEVNTLTLFDDGNSQTNTFWWVATRPPP